MTTIYLPLGFVFLSSSPLYCLQLWYDQSSILAVLVGSNYLQSQFYFELLGHTLIIFSYVNLPFDSLVKSYASGPGLPDSLETDAGGS